ncbi:hypothetical protein SETIT_2G054000v2 [Setaria italica]|uniref:Response regulatory domain-containing protein n=1 Tax=Setaria italica TaxID=4555 RepID=A0A368PVW3_SETIT|nr:hypothetical protein SETIT_2G054000v2 [Setaria italica]
MEDDMAVMFPNRIRTLIVDDDAKFLKSASRLLSILDFDVVVCSNVAYALKSLTNGNLEGFDVILVHAAKAAACGFNFRAIVEANLLIPVIYFLPQDHEATGDEADELLRALQAGTYVIKRPVDTNEVRSLLWKVIAYRKCELETQARRGGTGGEAGLDVAGEDEDRVHFKVIRGTSRKRKGSSSNPGGSSAGTTAAAAQPTPAEAVSVRASCLPDARRAALQVQVLLGRCRGEQQCRRRRRQRFRSTSCTASCVLSGAITIASGGTQHRLRQQHATGNSTNHGRRRRHCHIRATVLPSYRQPAAAGCPSSTDVRAIPIPGPAAAAVSAGDLFTGGMAGGASAAVAIDAVAYGNDASLSFLQPPNLGAEQDGGKQLAGTVGMDTHAGMADPPIAPQPVSSAIDSATMEWLLSDDFDDYVGGSPPAVAPNNQVLGMASNVDEPTTMAGGAFGSTSTNAASSMAPEDLVAIPDCGTTNAASFMAPHQDLGSMPNGGSSKAASFMALDVSDLTMAGGAFGDASPAPFMAAPQDLGAAPNGMVARDQDLSAAPNGDQVAQEDDTYGSVMGSQGQGAGAVMDGDDAMLPSDQYEDNTSFPPDEALLGDLHGPMFEFDDVVDLDAMLGGLTGGGAAAADDDDAGTSLIAGEEGGSMNGLGNLDGLKIPYELLGDFLFWYDRNGNNARE